jgi:NADPH2:quinone reductase
MSMMKQVVLRQHGGPDVLKIEEVAKPVPQKDEVLVEVRAAGVNFADVLRRTGAYHEKPSLPLVIGAEIAGIVAEVGPDVTVFKKGDRVLGACGVGGYSQYIAMSQTALHPLSDQIDFADSTALLIQGLTAYLLLTHAGAVQDKTIVIEGAAGGVGSLMVQIARNIGVKTIIGMASTEEKRALIRKLGAHHAVDSLATNQSEEIKKLTEGKGADVYYEMRGGANFHEAVKSLNQFGTLVTYGNASGGETKFDPSNITLGNQSVRGFYIGGYFSPTHFQLALEATQALIGMYAEGKLVIAVQKYALNDVGKAHSDIGARKTTGKVVLEPWA